jgi:hypothetical protein
MKCATFWTMLIFYAEADLITKALNEDFSTVCAMGRMISLAQIAYVYIA